MEEWNEMKGDGVDCGAELVLLDIVVRIPNTDRYFFSEIFRSSIHVGLILSKKINMILM